MELTLIHTTLEGDVFFPKFDLQEWERTSETYREPDEKNEFAMTFRTYERR